MIYRLKVKNENAWELLYPLVDSILFSEDENGSHYIWVESSCKPEHSAILEAEERTLPGYDWNAQWEQHAPGYNGEYVPLEIDGKILKLIPGPGFGDLSHPTTQLVLKMMPDAVRNKHVLDVGSGSGVLSVAAAACGASSVWAIDIDPQAEEHTQLNAAYNQVDVHVGKTPEGLPLVVLINMILSEQKAAIETLQSMMPMVENVIASGILASQLDEAQKLWPGFKLYGVEQKDGWLAIGLNRSDRI